MPGLITFIPSGALIYHASLVAESRLKKRRKKEKKEMKEEAQWIIDHLNDPPTQKEIREEKEYKEWKANYSPIQSIVGLSVGLIVLLLFAGVCINKYNRNFLKRRKDK